MGIQMIERKLRSRTLIVVFAATLLFCTANLISYYLMPAHSTMDDGFVYFGWPFTIYWEGGIAGTRAISWTGVIGNVVLAICVSRILIKVLDHKFHKTISHGSHG